MTTELLKTRIDISPEFAESVKKDIVFAAEVRPVITGKITAYRSMIAEYRKKLKEGAFISSMVPMYEALVEKYEYTLETLEELVKDVEL